MDLLFAQTTSNWSFITGQFTERRDIQYHYEAGILDEA
jgi:hypothetical protein